MSPDVKTSFLTYYIQSLAERTRVEKTGTKIGFDWIIYNLALADDLTPYRLPFFRGGPNETSKTKTEPEAGIDCSFISPDRKTLTIFVLKDEALCNAKWIANDFDRDLRMAAHADLTPVEFKDIHEVRIVLAYNKDEDQQGIRHFDSQARALGTKIGDNVKLSFERWNLTTLTEKVSAQLLTPSLLPQKFFSLFNYICSQFGDFTHGSDKWTEQLIPNWRRFLHDLLNENADERSVRLIPVALIILREHGGDNLSVETGWIDLAEWAMLSAWEVHQSTENKSVKKAIIQMWFNFYMTELERYYQNHNAELAVEHGLATHRGGNYLDAIITAVISHWHIARLGILGSMYSEWPILNENEKKVKTEAVRRITNWLVSLLNANPGANRPLLDINHIELFLIWRMFWLLQRTNDIYGWLISLRSCLLVRRAGTIPIPFIEGRNSLDLVFEYVATGQKPPEFCDQSSLLVLFLLELCFSLPPTQRNELVTFFYRELALGQDSFGEQMKDCKPLDLMGWGPPQDWGRKVLVKTLADEGESQTIEMLDLRSGIDGAGISAHIESFVRQSRAARKFEFPEGLPVSVVILACLKYRSPLPPEIWRLSIFGPLAPDGLVTSTSTR